ncbi:MAG: LamG-like jellyroll fold domain-containing protein [Leptospirales bacterium]
MHTSSSTITRIKMSHIKQMKFIRTLWFCILLSGMQCSAANMMKTIFKGDGSLIFSETELHITEGALAGNFNITLAAKPTHDVSVSLAVSDDSEIIIAPENITFSTDDYNIPRVVIVYGLADCTTDGDQNVTITTTEVTSKDRRFRSSENSYLLVNEVAVTVRDNALNVPELFLLSDKTTLETSESGGNDKFLVSLSCAPVANVTVNLASSNIAEGILDTATVNLDSSNYATGQLVTVTGQSDCTLEADQAYSVSASIALAGLSDPVNDVVFDGLADSIGVTNQNIEMTKQLMISSAGTQVNRGSGSFNNFQAKLSCAPVADFTMNAVVNSLPNGFTLHSPAPNPHTFLLADWAKPVDIINEVTSDFDGAYSITLTPADVSYPAETVYFVDSPTKRVTITTAGLTPGESYEIQNFTDKKEIASLGSSIWWAVNGDPYSFKISRQPNGQVCSIITANVPDLPHGTLTGIMDLNVDCKTGYQVNNQVLLSDPSAKDNFPVGMLYTTMLSSTTYTNPTGMAIVGNTMYVVDWPGNLYSVPLAGGAPSPIAISGGALNNPSGLVTDGQYVYVSDRGNHRIVKILVNTTPTAPRVTGELTVVAGTGVSGTPVDTADPLLARFNQPEGLVLKDDYLYVADRLNHSIQRVHLPTGAVILFADMGTTCEQPVGLASNDTYLFAACFGSNNIAKVHLTSQAVSNVAGLPGVGNSGVVDGVGNSARMTSPTGLVYMGNTLVFSEWNSGYLRRINISNVNSPVVKTALGHGVVAATVAPADFSLVQFNNAQMLATDGESIYYSDFNNNNILKMTQGLAAHYKLAGDFNDSSGNGNDGNLIGTPTTGVDDPHGGTNAVSGFSLADYIKVTDSPSLNPASLSVSVWLNPTSLPGPGVINVILGNNSTIPGYFLELYNDGANQRIYWRAGGTPFSVPIILPTNQYSHISITHNGPSQTATLYINGIFITSAGSRAVVPQGLNYDLLIGRRSDGSPAFDGAISDLRIYNRALTATEVNRLSTRIPDGLVAYYPFDDAASGTAVDYSSFVNNGTLGGGMSAAANRTYDRFGKANSAYRFNGVGNFITARDSFLPVGTAPRTICHWVRARALNSGTTVGYGTGSAPNGRANGFQFTSADVGYTTFSSDVFFGKPVPLFEWSHICGTYDGTKAAIYMDGKLVVDPVAPPVAWDTTLSGLLHIGENANGGSDYFSGDIDEIRIYDRVLSDKEILFLADKPFNPTGGLVAWYPLGGDTKDYSGNGNNGTLNGTSIPATGPHGDTEGAAYFDGTTNYVDAGANPEADVPHSMSISVWIKPDQLPALNGIMGILGKSDGTGGYFLELFKDDGLGSTYSPDSFPVPGTRVFYSGNAGTNALAPRVNFPINQYSHIAVVHEGTNVEIFVNGKRRALTTTGGNIAVNTATAPLYLGRRHDGSPFKGAISDVRIYNRPLSALEIARLATQVPDSLAVYYPLDEVNTVGAQKFTPDLGIHNIDGLVLGPGAGVLAVDRHVFSSSSMRFDGIDDVVDAPTTNYLPIGNSPRTFCGWYKAAGTLSTNFIASYGTNGVNMTMGLIIYPTVYNFWTLDYATNVQLDTNPIPVTLGKWTNLCGTFDGSNMKLYLNGTWVATRSGVTLATGNGPLRIGQRIPTPPWFPFNGDLDDIRVYSRALSAGELLAISGIYP